MLRATDVEGLAFFKDWLYRVRPRVVVHSLLYDATLLRRMGINIFDFVIEDTAILAYLLQLEPRGLKGGCLRHCGMQMQEYTEVIGDVANTLARDYLTWLWDSEQVDYEEAQHEEFDRQRAAGRRIKILPKLPKTPLHKAVSRVLQSQRPAGLWQDQDADIQVAGHYRLGALPAATLDYVSPAVAIHYGCRDADGTLRLLPEYLRRVDALGLRPVYDLELGSYPFIDRMQRIGVKPDLAYFQQFSATLQGEIERLRGDLARTTGRDTFNANSGAQVADYLFGTLGLEELKMTPSGDRGSTDDKILEALEHEHPEFPVISDIRKHRETYKLKHTFVDCLPDFVNRWPFDGRIHAAFRSTLVTGRLAASDPNMLAQPEHGTFAEGFKRGWIAEPGHSLCSWDECLVPGTRILTADLTWVPIETLEPGVPLIGLEESITNGKERKTLTTHVVRTSRKTKHCYEIVLSNGTQVTASDEHPWLTRRSRQGASGRPYAWTVTSALTPGDQLSKFIEPWTMDESREAGWLAGFFDGEGCLSATNGTLTLTQNPGPLMEYAKALLYRRGYDFHVDSPRRHPSGYRSGGQQTEVLWMCGVRDCLHFLGTIRPRRLLQKASRLWEGRISLKKKHGKRSPVDSTRVTVVEIRDAGLQDVITLETTSHTFIAEGYHTHNSQVELRGLAELSHDPVLLQAFRTGQDLHAKLAHRIFGGPESQYLSKCYERFAVKEINFGIPNGMGPKGLMLALRAKGVDADLDTATRWLEETQKLYKGVEAYKRACVAEALQHGYIRCLSGRIRYIGGIRSREEYVRAEAERLSFSTKIQESATLIMKQAEATIWDDVLPYFWKKGHWVEPILQVHDCIKMECEEGLEQELHVLMTEAMTQVPKTFCVPLAVEGEFGPNMADMRPFTSGG